MPEKRTGIVQAEGTNILDKTVLIHEETCARVIQHQGRTVAEFPLSAGVVGALLAPVLAAVGAIVALLKDCTIQVERGDRERTEHTPTGTDSP